MSLPDIPTISELTDNALVLMQQGLVDAAVITSGLSAADIDVARSNQRVLAFAQGVGVYGAYQYLQREIAPQAIPTTATSDSLSLWMRAYGIPRKDAIAAAGVATGQAMAGVVIAGGTELQHTSGVIYIATADAVAGAAGSVSVPVVCVNTGITGNLAAGEKLVFVGSIDGVESEFVVDVSGIAGGTDDETDAEAQYRLQQRLANPPRGSSPADYERWALSVPGITRAWGVRNPSGATSAGVIIVADNNPNRLPTEQQQQAVYAYVTDPDRGPPDEFFAIIPEPVYIDVVVGIQPDTAAVRAAVTVQLEDLFYREALPGSRLPISHITEAISGANGETDHQLFQPEPVSGGYLSVTQFQMLILRSVAFQAMTNG